MNTREEWTRDDLAGLDGVDAADLAVMEIPPGVGDSNPDDDLDMDDAAEADEEAPAAAPRRLPVLLAGFADRWRDSANPSELAVLFQVEWSRRGGGELPKDQLRFLCAEALSRRGAFAIAAEARFTRTNLATADASTPELLLGIAYRGFQCTIAGPTGSAKTMLAQWLGLEAIRAGLAFGHWDMEMGAQPIAFRYRAMGATDDELAAIAYYPWPSPTLADSDAFVEQIVRVDGSEIVLLDPTADFLGAAGLDENANDEVTRWAAAFPQRLTQEGVTTISIDGMPHDGTRQRGASQKGYKAATVWTVEVLDEPTKDHVGSVILTCAKDRFGAVGKGATLVFGIGGDGTGKIVVTRQAAMERPSKVEQHDVDEHLWLGIVVVTVKRHAPDADHPISQNQLVTLMPPGKAIGFRREVCRRASSNPLVPVLAKPGPNRSVMYWYEDAGGTGWDGVGRTHLDLPDSQDSRQVSPGESPLKTHHSPDAPPDSPEQAFAEYVNGDGWDRVASHPDSPRTTGETP